MKSVRVYNVFSFVQHMVKHIRKNAVVGHVIFGDGILCTHRFHHLRSVYVIRVVYYLIHFQDNIVCYFPFWKEDFVKKLQSCTGKADMFVERSRNKSIDKKSVLCYSEGTNYIQSIWTSRFSRGKNTS